MSKINISEVKKRNINLTSGFIPTSRVNVKTLYESVMGMDEKNSDPYNPANILMIASNWRELNKDEDISFNQLIDVFEVTCEYGSLMDIKKLAKIIAEVSVPKVRNAMQMQTYIKRKTSQVKTKISTKINNKIEDMKNAVANSLPNGVSIPSNPAVATNMQKEADKRIDTVSEASNLILEAINVCLQCDRVLTNHTNLNKKHNIDNFIKETANTKESINTYIMEMCRVVDSYNMPFKVKYNVALENTLYALSKQGMVFENKDIINNVTDYFLCAQPLNESTLETAFDKLKKSKYKQIQELGDLLEAANKDSYKMGSVEKLIIAINKIVIAGGAVLAGSITILVWLIAFLPIVVSSGIIIGIYINRIKAIEKAIAECKDPEDKKNMKLYLKSLSKSIKGGVKTESAVDDIKTVISNNKFYNESDMADIEFVIKQEEEKKGPNYFLQDDIYSLAGMSLTDNFVECSQLDSVIRESKINKAKEIINSFKIQNVKTPESIKNMLKKLLTCSGEEIVTETPNMLQLFFMIGVTVGAVAINPLLGCMVFLSTAFVSMTLQRNEMGKIISAYKNEKKKAETKLSKMKSEDAKEKCKAYIHQLDRDITKLEDHYEDLLSKDEKDEIRNKTNNDYNSVDEGFSQEAKDSAFNILLIESFLKEGVADWDAESILSGIDDNIDKLGLGDISALTEFALSFDDGLPVKELSYIYESNLKETRKRTDSGRHIRIDCLNDCIGKLKELSSTKKVFSENVLVGLNEFTSYQTAIKETLNQCNGVMLEMDYTNTIKLTMERLKKTASNLSDKEQMMSKTIDGSLESLKTNMEKAITNENRESVIRGSILPSASRIIKLAITSGLAWMVNPAIAVIGLIGSFAMAQKIKIKERQLILDELDVELVMVEKYIKIAEEKNDMKAMRELLTIQKKLEHQKSRLKYKMEIEWDQKTPKGTEDRDND